MVEPEEYLYTVSAVGYQVDDILLTNVQPYYAYQPILMIQ